MHVLTRDDAIKLSESGIFIAMHFPSEQGPGERVCYAGGKDCGRDGLSRHGVTRDGRRVRCVDCGAREWIGLAVAHRVQAETSHD